MSNKTPEAPRCEGPQGSGIPEAGFPSSGSVLPPRRRGRRGRGGRRQRRVRARVPGATLRLGAPREPRTAARAAPVRGSARSCPGNRGARRRRWAGAGGLGGARGPPWPSRTVVGARAPGAVPLLLLLVLLLLLLRGGSAAVGEHPGISSAGQARPTRRREDLHGRALARGRRRAGAALRERGRVPGGRSPEMHLHQVLTGAVNPGDNCYSVGSVGDVPFTVSGGGGPGECGVRGS